uniref:Ribosome-recycling factor, chloroplastic n=1 Tax=Cajanus cajan TaxID=3821 RepID=A0A151R151_CAJCA|nr:Ribosome-recycling factor [Cajanus cajan]
MEAAMAALSAELSKLQTGRASPGMLDHIIVETSGLKMPFAVVSVLDPKTLSVNPYDPEVFYLGKSGPIYFLPLDSIKIQINKGGPRVIILLFFSEYTIISADCDVDDLTKKFIKTAEDVCKAKEKEISQG